MHEKQRKSEMKKILFKKITNNPFGFVRGDGDSDSGRSSSSSRGRGSWMGRGGGKVGGSAKEMSVYYSWY